MTAKPLLDAFRDYLSLFKPRKAPEPVNISYSKDWLDQQQLFGWGLRQLQ